MTLQLCGQFHNAHYVLAAFQPREQAARRTAALAGLHVGYRAYRQREAVAPVGKAQQLARRVGVEQVRGSVRVLLRHQLIELLARHTLEEAAARQYCRGGIGRGRFLLVGGQFRVGAYELCAPVVAVLVGDVG